MFKYRSLAYQRSQMLCLCIGAWGLALLVYFDSFELKFFGPKPTGFQGDMAQIVADHGKWPVILVLFITGAIAARLARPRRANRQPIVDILPPVHRTNNSDG